jgi:hypothetical protein
MIQKIDGSGLGGQSQRRRDGAEQPPHPSSGDEASQKVTPWAQ